MEIKLIHILGPVFSIVAMFFYGKAFVSRSQGKQVRIGPAMILVVGAMLFVFITGDGTLLDRVCWVLLNFGIAMIIDSRYLAMKKEHPKVFWVPGVLALVLSAVIYFVSSLFGLSVNGLFDGTGESDITNGEVLIELGPDDDISELKPILEEYDGKYKRAFPYVSMDENEDLAQYYLIDLPDGKAEGFLTAVKADKENVDHVTMNFEIKLDQPLGTMDSVWGSEADDYSGRDSAKGEFGTMSDHQPNDPAIFQQWWLAPEVSDNLFALLKDLQPRRKAIVAIVDTGVDGSHEDLSDAFGKSPGNKDVHGHGTHCAGLAGAVTNNHKGIASLNWEGRFVEVRGYQALGDDGRGDLYRVARAITQAAEDGADVISLSLGSHSPTPPRLEEQAIAYAQKLGCIVVAAAGNDGGMDARDHSPSNIQGVIAVSATTVDDRRADFSNINTRLKMPIAAPGKDIYSTTPDGKYESFSGTSMATPLVSGLIGVMRSLSPTLSATQAWQILHRTGRVIGESGDVGRVINPLAALQMTPGI